MKTSELEGAQLAEWAARANGWKVERDGDGPHAELICWDELGVGRSFSKHGYRPDLNWAQGGAIIDREAIAIYRDEYRDGSGRWDGFSATVPLVKRDPDHTVTSGPTHLVAAMRAYVASKFGATVPDE